MKLVFLIIIILSAMLIVGGVLVLSLGRRERRRREANKKTRSSESAGTGGSTISLSLAEESAEQPAAEPAAPQEAVMPDPAAAIETALNMGPALMSVARIHAESEEERQAKLRQALLFLQGAETLCTLEDALKKWSAAKSADKKTALMTEIQACLTAVDTEAIRTACKTTFDAMYPAFSDNLRNIAPDLSEAELRLCSFLALGQSTRDMALLTRRSVRTIETTIYHLRKKLAMPTEEKTADFLRKHLF